jgi:ATP-binding cassette subfamily B protein
MDQGHIVEQGSHDELMASHGFYYDLYKSQFEEAIVEAA